jgi:hypothetical protein
MGLTEIGLGAMNRIDLVQDRDKRRVVVNTVMNLRVSQNFGEFFNKRATESFTRTIQLHTVSY